MTNFEKATKYTVAYWTLRALQDLMKSRVELKAVKTHLDWALGDIQKLMESREKK